MRDAAAALDDDFGYDVPASKKSARKSRAISSGKRKRKGRRFSWNNVARYGAIAISTTVAVGILVNALLMQKGRHPAPLFGKSLVPRDETAAVVATPAVVPKPNATPVMAAPEPDATPATGDASPPASKPHRTASAKHNADASGDDPIAQLLGGAKPPMPTAEKSEGKTLLGVQKALIKLGFSVKANGTMGATTRKAIEAFEKDRNLPVKGEVNKRLVKVLAAESGVHID